MMGMSLSPITGQIVSEIVSGEKPAFDLSLAFAGSLRVRERGCARSVSRSTLMLLRLVFNTAALR